MHVSMQIYGVRGGAGGEGGAGGDCGIGGGSGEGMSERSRGPQLRQSVPKAQAAYSAPGLPSSQSLSEACTHVSMQM